MGGTMVGIQILILYIKNLSQNAPKPSIEDSNAS
jgi:hypothetical protein